MRLDIFAWLQQIVILILKYNLGISRRDDSSTTFLTINCRRQLVKWQLVGLTVALSRFLPSQFTVKLGEWDLSDLEDYSREINIEEITYGNNFTIF